MLKIKIMKQNLLVLSTVVLILNSCGKKEEAPTAGKDDRMEITPFMVTKVFLKDTVVINREYTADSTHKQRAEPAFNYDGNPVLFLNEKQFGQFKEVIWALINDPKSKVLVPSSSVAPEWKPADKSRLHDRLIICDSVAQISFDKNGDEVATPVWACDSVSIVDAIGKIHFYESWYFNKTTNMIERDVLGYSVFQYVVDKQAYRQLFYVFRDEQAFIKVKKLYDEL